MRQPLLESGNIGHAGKSATSINEFTPLIHCGRSTCRNLQCGVQDATVPPPVVSAGGSGTSWPWHFPQGAVRAGVTLRFDGERSMHAIEIESCESQRAIINGLRLTSDFDVDMHAISR